MNIISKLSDLNIRRRRALVEYLVKEDFRKKGFKTVKFDIDRNIRITISDDTPIYISFDLTHASDYKEDAYMWCYVDFFILKPDINIPDELKKVFTRFIDQKNKKIYWRHRILSRIIDMDMAVEHIINTRDRLLELLNKYDIKL